MRHNCGTIDHRQSPIDHQRSIVVKLDDTASWQQLEREISTHGNSNGIPDTAETS